MSGTTGTYKKCRALCDTPMYVFDFTLWLNKPESKDDWEITKDTLKIGLIDQCKKWCFQLELSEGGFHFQGRVSFKTKTRNPPILIDKIHWSLTSKENKDNDFYACKIDTRNEGPWKDTDMGEIYIPKQIRELNGNILKWQQQVMDKSQEWDTRHIDLVVDPDGNKGKSILKGIMLTKGMAAVIPFVNDYKDIMRMVMDMPKSKTYIIDLPRAIKKDKLFQMYAGIESIKDGYAYDDRYSFRWEYFDCPNIWVFTNTMPDIDYMTKGRWRIWNIVNGELFKKEITSDDEIKEFNELIKNKPKFVYEA